MLKTIRSAFLVSLVAACIGAGTVTAIEKPELTGEEIARANSSVWDSVFAIEAKYDVNTRRVEGGKVLLDVWSRGNQLRRRNEQFRVVHKDVDSGGIVDRFVDGQEEYTLHYPSALDPHKAGITACNGTSLGVVGFVRKAIPRISATYIPSNLEFVQFMSVSPPLRLADILRMWKCAVEPISGKDGKKKYVVSASYPAAPGSAFAGSIAKIVVDPTKGCLMEKVSISEFGVATSVKTGQPIPTRAEWEVLDWQSQNGLELPKTVEYRVYGDPNPNNVEANYIVTCYFSDVSVNTDDSVKEPRLGFRFPENSTFKEELPDNSPGRFYIYGKDNEILELFVSGEAYGAYIRAKCDPDPVVGSNSKHPAGSESQKVGATSRWLFRPLMVINISIFLVVGIVFLYFRTRRKKG